MLWSRRRVVLGSLLAAGPAGAFGIRASAAPVAGSLAGQLLVASPGMRGSEFVRTVILMVEHDPTGALGLVINRPVGERPVAELLRALGQDAGNAHGKLTLYAGGPVQPGVGFVVHSSEYRVPGTLVLDEHVAVSSAMQVLRDIGADRGPRKRMLVLGYAGWAAMQLEAELSLGAWLAVPALPELVFDLDREKLWEAALSERTIPL